MSIVQIIDGDVLVRGTLQTTGQIAVGAGSITNAMVAAGAAISSTKLEHQHRKDYAQPNAAAITETKVVHTVIGTTGTIKAFKAGSIGIAVGNSTVTLDLKKNGTTCLSAVITLDVNNVARIVESGTLTVTTLVVGDVLEIVVVATIGTGTLPTGVFATVDLFEDAA